MCSELALQYLIHFNEKACISLFSCARILFSPVAIVVVFSLP